jgi:hypothetical protein
MNLTIDTLALKVSAPPSIITMCVCAQIAAHAIGLNIFTMRGCTQIAAHAIAHNIIRPCSAILQLCSASLLAHFHARC